MWDCFRYSWVDKEVFSLISHSQDGNFNKVSLPQYFILQSLERGTGSVAPEVQALPTELLLRNWMYLQIVHFISFHCGSGMKVCVVGTPNQQGQVPPNRTCRHKKKHLAFSHRTKHCYITEW